MFLPFRGARATGRAGAFTAGVDDASALYYNPAGMADIDDWSFLVDGALVLQRAGYDRVDSGGNPQPHVDGSMNVLPIPTLALTWKPRQIKGRWVTFGFGVWVPYLGVNTLAGERTAALQQHLAQRLAAQRRRAGGLLPHQGLALARRRPAEHDPALPQPRHALGLLGAQLRARGSRLRHAHAGRHRLGLHAVGRSSAPSSRSRSSASGSTCSCRSSCARRARWRRGCRPIRSSPTPTVNGDAISVDFNLPLTVRLGVEYRPSSRLRARARPRLRGVVDAAELQDHAARRLHLGRPRRRQLLPRHA